jgi:class 3 adenylate cyclase/streptogramin lyase
VAGSTGTRGFLFADLRGYTRFVEQHGDATASELLARYRSLVRDVVGAHAGAEIRTEGDGIYVVFDSVTGAVDAGLELVEAAAAATSAEPGRPLRVAVGIHAGETTASDEGPVGSAVNIAARVCAKAQAGELLVTDTVRSLVRTARPYRATALGGQRLKGVAGAIPLFRLERTASPTRARLRRQVGARRGRLAVAGLAAAGLLVGAGAVWAANRPADCLGPASATRDVVVRIDPDRACVVQVIPVGARPGPIVATDDAVWVANRDDWTVMRIDPEKGTVMRSIGVPGSPVALGLEPPRSLVLLMYNDREGTGLAGVPPILSRVGRIDGARSRLTDVSALPGETGYVALVTVGGRAWITNQRLGGVLISPGLETIVVEEPVDVTVVGPQVLSSGIGPIDVGQGAIWIANLHRPEAYLIDGPNGRPGAVSLNGDVGSTSIDVTSEAVWFGRDDGSVTRLDLGGRQQTSHDTGGSVAAIAAGPDVAWITDDQARVVRRIVPSTGELAAVPVGGRPSGLAIAGDGSVFVSIAAP